MASGLRYDAPMMRLLPLGLGLFLLAGCDTKVKEKYVEPPPLPLLDLQLFPSIPGGSRLLAEVASARIEFDPTAKDAIVAVGLCVDAAAYCYEPGVKSLEECLAGTRTCATNEPWNEQACCPDACKKKFSAAVKKGVAEAEALDQVFFQERDCFPGLQAALEAP